MNNRGAIKAASQRRQCWPRQPDDPGTMRVIYMSDLHMVRYRQRHNGDDFAVLTAEYTIIVNGRTITAPAGMAFGPSIPKRTRGIVSVPECIEASVPHDYLYRTGTGTRKEADDIFRQIVKDQSGAYTAWKAWLALRAFGGKNWKPNRD